MTDKGQPIGCTALLIGVNGMMMGLTAISFVQGPYSSPTQELWYRYGSLGFLFGGAILPAFALALGARRSRPMLFAMNVWAITALFGWCAYVFMSGGGV